MVKAHDVAALVGKRVKLMLDIAEAALPENQFRAFRRVTLRQFGDDGLGADLERLFSESGAGKEGNGRGRN